jgi:hypothetical protein
VKTKHNPTFIDASGMSPGDIITYDPSKEGTGGCAEGKIEEISRSRLSVVLEDKIAIGASRIYAYRHPGGAITTPLPPATISKERRERRWPTPKERYISHPF